MYENVEIELQEKVAWIYINRPPLNILDLKTMKEMIHALKEIEESQVIVTVISAKGKHFSAGAEIKEHFPDKAPELISTFSELVKAIVKSDKITIAAVRGYALGGGCEVPLACDMILASEKAKFGQPEILLGHYPPIAISLLPRMIGVKKAFELILTGDAIDAKTAMNIGLVNHVYSEDEFEEKVKEFAENLTKKSPIALKLTKKALQESISMPIDEVMEIVNTIYLNRLIQTEDSVEGLTAFLEKRDPVWKGK
jgi:cyclohexa-1,5-dienecarbonyl-CoA hydratase